MTPLVQALWDQMRTELRTEALPPMQQACQALLGNDLGALTAPQLEDIQAVERSLAKLNGRVEGEPIDWSDYSEAAHALRGPLNSTIGFSRLMLKGMEGPINASQRDALETIHSVSRKLLVLFNLLLDGLLLVKQELVVDVEHVQANAILQELIAAGRTLANTRAFIFESDISNQVGEAIIEIDPKRLTQALTGVLAVAVKYMGDGKVTLRAWLSAGRLYIELQNRTCQLPPALLGNLRHLLTPEADPIFSYDAHLRLGLAAYLVEQMRGILEAQQSGDECTFRVSLPAR